MFVEFHIKIQIYQQIHHLLLLFGGAENIFYILENRRIPFIFSVFYFLWQFWTFEFLQGKKLSFPTYYYAIVHSIPLILNLLFLVTYGPSHFCLCIFFLFFFLMDYSSSCCFLVLIFSKETAQGFNNSAVIYPGF